MNKEEPFHTYLSFTTRNIPEKSIAFNNNPEASETLKAAHTVYYKLYIHPHNRLSFPKLHSFALLFCQLFIYIKCSSCIAAT